MSKLIRSDKEYQIKLLNLPLNLVSWYKPDNMRKVNPGRIILAFFNL